MQGLMSAGNIGVLDQQREAMRASYARGALDEAVLLQRRVIETGLAAGAALPEDFLFLALILYAQQRLADGIATLREAERRFPESAPVQENLGVFLLQTGDSTGAIACCRRAIELGSDSPNVHDCLCDAYGRIGRLDLAVAAGRAALEAKDRQFGGGAPVATIPDAMPPSFNALNPAENVIAYCLWGSDHRYLIPLLENARIQPHIFPGWTLRLYHDVSVPADYLAQLRQHGVQLVARTLPPDVPPHRRLLWRFDVIADPAVRRFLIRDADSLLCVKERVAIDAWLLSRCYFHVMRDWYSHTDLLLAGMWGGVANILPPTEQLMQSYRAWRVENNHVDQDVLSETVWPTIRRSCLIHDSVFTGCLGSVPFPPFGDQPPGRHIGENAFLQFTPNG